jgi:hypothetical protein
MNTEILRRPQPREGALRPPHVETVSRAFQPASTENSGPITFA